APRKRRLEISARHDDVGDRRVDAGARQVRNAHAVARGDQKPAGPRRVSFARPTRASPRAGRGAPAGPLTAAPPTIGLTATTGARVERSASTIPGTARIGPTDVTGLDGHKATTSAARSASPAPRD